MLTNAGIYDVPFAEYLGKGLTPTPCLSASVITTMLQESPKHAAYRHPDIGGKVREVKTPQSAAVIGTAAHAIILKQEDDRIALSPHAEFRTNEAKAWRDAQHANKKIIIKSDDYEDAKAIAAAFPAMVSQFNKELGEEFPTENFEKTVVVQIEGVWCKIRIDAIGKSIRDVKTSNTDMNPAKWSKNQISAMGYDISAAFYKRVWKELTGEDKRFILDVIEQEDPYDGYSLIIPDVWLETANEQIDWALKKWKHGLETGHWDGYASGRVIYAYPPPWVLAAWEERKEREKTLAEIEKREAA